MTPRPLAPPAARGLACLSLALAATLATGCAKDDAAVPVTTPTMSPSAVPSATGDVTALATDSPTSSTSAPASSTASPVAGVTGTPTSSGAPSRMTAAPVPSPSTSATTSARVELPEGFNGWKLLQAEEQGAWRLAGYSDGNNTIQLRASRRATSTPSALAVELTQGKPLTIDGTACSVGARRQACAQLDGEITAAISSTTLEAEEIAPLLTQVLAELD